MIETAIRTNGISSALELQARLFGEAMKACVGLPGTFVAAMDASATGGSLPTAAEVSETIEKGNPDWDGLAPDGTFIDAAEEMAWCTARARWGWGLPSEEALAAVVRFARAAGGLVEVGAGSGHWSACAAARSGVPVHACDDRSGSWDDWERHSWYDIEISDGLEFVRRHTGLPVLMIWSDSNGIAARIAESLEPGRVLIRGGSMRNSGDDRFIEVLNAWFDLVEQQPSVACSGSQENMHFLVKRAERRPEGEQGPFPGIVRRHWPSRD